MNNTIQSDSDWIPIDVNVTLDQNSPVDREYIHQIINDTIDAKFGGITVNLLGTDFSKVGYFKDGSYYITIAPISNSGGPSGTYSLFKNGIDINIIRLMSSIPGNNSLQVSWDTDNVLAIRKTGSKYDGEYLVDFNVKNILHDNNDNSTDTNNDIVNNFIDEYIEENTDEYIEDHLDVDDIDDVDEYTPLLGSNKDINYQEKYTELHIKYHDLEVVCDEYDQVLEEYIAETEKITDEYNDLNTKFNFLESFFETTKEALDESRLEHQELSENYQRIMQQNSDLRDRNETLEEQVEYLKDNIQQLEDDYDNLQDKYEDRHDDYRQLEDDYRQLEDELETLDDELETLDDNWNQEIECTIQKLETEYREQLDTLMYKNDILVKLNQEYRQKSDLLEASNEIVEIQNRYLLEENQQLKQDGLIIRKSFINETSTFLPNLFQCSTLTVTSLAVAGASQSYKVYENFIVENESFDARDTRGNFITHQNFMLKILDYGLIELVILPNAIAQYGIEYLVTIKKDPKFPLV